MPVVTWRAMLPTLLGGGGLMTIAVLYLSVLRFFSLTLHL